MGLGHAGFGAVVDVVHQCVEKVQGGLAAIDVPRAFGAVSYTHLTLPTNREV